MARHQKSDQLLQLAIGKRENLDPNTDPLKRSFMGTDTDQISEQEAWEIGRGIWNLDAERALRAGEVQIVSRSTGTVLAVAVITGVTNENMGSKRALIGYAIPGDPRVGLTTKFPQPSRNALYYVPKP